MDEQQLYGVTWRYRLARAMTPLVAAALAAACQTSPPSQSDTAPNGCPLKDLQLADLRSRGTDYNIFRIVVPGRLATYLTGEDLSADIAVGSLQVPAGALLYRASPPYEDVVFGRAIVVDGHKMLQVGRSNFDWGGKHFQAVLRSMGHLGRDPDVLLRYESDPRTAPCVVYLRPEAALWRLVR